MESFRPRAAVLRRALQEGEAARRGGMLSVDEACEYLGISKWTLYRLIHKHELKSIKIGARRLVPQQALVELVEALEADSGSSR